MHDWVTDLERRSDVHTLSLMRWRGKRHETNSDRLAQTIRLCDTNTAWVVN